MRFTDDGTTICFCPLIGLAIWAALAGIIAAVLL